MHSTIATCIVHAHFENIGTPGTYEKALKLLTKNKLAPVKAPVNPPSRKILNAYYGPELREQEAASTEGMNMDETEVEPEITETAARTTDISVTKTTTTPKTSGKTSEPTTIKIPEIPPIKGTEIGLVIYTSESVGWPKEKQSSNRLARKMEENKYKWTYADKLLEENEIINLVRNNHLNTDNCFMIVQDAIFNKIRTGLIEDRSPQQRTDNRRKLNS